MARVKTTTRGGPGMKKVSQQEGVNMRHHQKNPRANLGKNLASNKKNAGRGNTKLHD